MKSIPERQYLIHLNTGVQGRTPVLSGINYGEIAINYNSASPEIMFKSFSGAEEGQDEFIVHVIDEVKTQALINAAQSDIDGRLATLSAATEGLSAVTVAFSGATDKKFSDVSGYFLTHIATVSGNIETTIKTVSGDIKDTIDAEHNELTGFSATIISNVNTLSANTYDDIRTVSGHIKETIETVSGNIKDTIDAEHNAFTAFSGYMIENYATSASTHAAIEAVKSDLGKVYKYKGSVETYAELEAISATTELNDGDVYNVQTASDTPGTAGYIPAGANFAWVTDSVPGEHGHWDMLGGTIDLSTYATTAYVGTVSGNIKNTIETVSGYIEDTIETVSGRIKSTIETVSGNIENTIKTVSGYIEDTIEANNTAFTAFSAYVVNTYATSADVNTISGWIVSHLQETDQNVTELSAGVESVSGYIVDYVDNTVSAGVHNTITGLSASTINIETKLGQLSGETMAIQSGYVRTINFAENADYGVTASKDENVTGATYTFDFSKLHIDCGSF